MFAFRQQLRVHRDKPGENDVLPIQQCPEQCQSIEYNVEISQVSQDRARGGGVKEEGVNDRNYLKRENVYISLYLEVIFFQCCRL